MSSICARFYVSSSNLRWEEILCNIRSLATVFLLDNVFIHVFNQILIDLCTFCKNNLLLNEFINPIKDHFPDALQNPVGIDEEGFDHAATEVALHEEGQLLQSLDRYV